MDDIIRTAVNDAENTDIIKKQVENKTDDILIRKPVIGIGGETPTPNIEEITITENGTTTAPSGVDGYNPINVNVPQPTLTSITITENGTTTAPSGTAYNEITVNVAEPTTKVVSEFDFSEQEYDLVRSINPDNPEPSEHALLTPYLYNATYDSINGVVAWSNGYGSIQTKYYIEPFKNYDIDIEFGDITSTSTSERQILGMGMGITIYWDGGNNRVRVGNSSGSLYFNDVNSIDYFQNKTVRIIVEWGHDGVYTPTCYAFIKFDGIAERKFIGNIDPSASNSNYLIVGRTTSDDGIYPAQVKKIKITEKNWIIEENRNLESEVE